MGCCYSHKRISFDVRCIKGEKYHDESGYDNSEKCKFYLIEAKWQCNKCLGYFIHHPFKRTFDEAWMLMKLEHERDCDKKKLLAAEDKIKVLIEMVDKQPENKREDLDIFK